MKKTQILAPKDPSGEIREYKVSPEDIEKDEMVLKSLLNIAQIGSVIGVASRGAYLLAMGQSVKLNLRGDIPETSVEARNMCFGAVKALSEGLASMYRDIDIPVKAEFNDGEERPINDGSKFVQ